MRNKGLNLMAVFILGLAFLGSTYVSLESKLSDLNFSQKELLGIQLHSALFDLQDKMESYRRQVFLSRNSAEEMREFARIGKELESNIENVDRLFSDPEYKDFIVAQGRWKQLRESTFFMKTENINYTQAEMFDDRTDIIERLDILMKDVGVESNLVLEPEVSPYFMASMMINNIPRAVEYVRYLKGKTTGLLETSKEILSEDEYDLIRYMSRQYAFGTDYLYALSIIKKVKGKGGEVEYADLTNAMKEMSEFHDLFPRVISHKQPISSQDFFAKGVKSIKSLQVAYQHLSHDLKEHIASRVRVILWQISFILTGAICMFVLAAIAVYVAQRNITRKEEVETARQVKAIIQTALDAIMTINDRGILQGFNPSAERLFGYKSEEVVGKNVSILMPEPYHSEHDTYIRNYFSTGKQKILNRVREIVAQKKDGTVFPIELVVNQFEYAGQRMFVGSIRDISKRKEAEQQQQVLIQKLTNANTELERFAYVASHDMQEPIRMVANFCALLSEEYSNKLDETGMNYLDIVTSSAQRMQMIISDLLEYARTGADSAHFDMVDCQAELMHVLENLDRLIQERQARVTYDALPFIKGNAVQFMRLLQNLVGNGLKYQAQGVTPAVHVGVQDRGNYWLFSVKDNGIGIDQQYHKAIFEPFKRLHSWQEYKGTGIGLAICHKIVENHGGKIWVESASGQGSTFFFTFPKIQPEGRHEH